MNANTTLREARELMIRAAIKWTKIRNGRLQKACLLVLLDGVGVSEAARRASTDKIGRKIANVTRQDVYRALKSVRPRLAEVQAHVEKELQQ